MEKQRLAFEDIYPAGARYSRAVRAGNLLFISGCTANRSDAAEGGRMEQLRVVLDRITRMVAAEGGKPSDIVKLTTFVTEPKAWFPADEEQIGIFDEFFEGVYPANTIVGASFPVDNVHIEIDAIAVLD